MSLPHQDLVLVISSVRDQAKELLTLGRPGPFPDQRVERRVPRARHAAEASGESGSTTTSCFPVRGTLATRRAGQHPWPAALLPFSDAERH